MASTAVLAEKLIAMLIMVAVGYAIAKVGLLKADASKVLSKLTLYVLVPCMLINAFQAELTPGRVRGFLAGLVVSFVVYAIWIILATLLKKPLKLSAVDQATIVYNNIGNLILPLVQMTLGEDMVFYALSIQIPFNCFVWTHCETIISGEKTFNIKKILLNTNIIAIVIGMILMLCNIMLPDVPATVISCFSDTVGPISMITIGMTIASQPLGNVIKCKKAYLVVFLRLIVFPLIAIGVIYVSGVLRAYKEMVPMLQVLVMAFAAPAASMVTQFAVIYDNDAERSGIYNVLGMILCVVTIPLINYIYQMIFA